MNIFYYSVHHILEDDEIRLFQGLGHSVFCLGINRKGGTDSPFRPSIDFSEREQHLYDIYESLGGKYSAATSKEGYLPPEFLHHFSLSVIMHDPGFIINHWNTLSVRPVIWRTIGQGVDHWEDKLRPFRAQGLKIVRYSLTEMYINNSIGQDDIIRFQKRSDYYTGWTGEDNSILTFANDFEARYPTEADEYRQIAEGFSFKLGGIKNEGFSQSIGLVTAEDQVGLYQRSRAYLYSTGLHIPYTLNFIEAWMTGIPVIIYAPIDRCERFFEIDRLVVDGRTGYVCRTIEQTREKVKLLLENKPLAKKIGEAGRTAAIAFFDSQHVGEKWQKFLQKTGLYQ